MRASSRWIIYRDSPRQDNPSTADCHLPSDDHFDACRNAGGRSDATVLASTWLASLPQLFRTNVTTSATCSSERRHANEGIANCAGVDAVRGVMAPFSTTETTEPGFAASTTGLPASGGESRP